MASLGTVLEPQNTINIVFATLNKELIKKNMICWEKLGKCKLCFKRESPLCCIDKKVIYLSSLQTFRVKKYCRLLVWLYI